MRRQYTKLINGDVEAVLCRTFGFSRYMYWFMENQNDLTFFITLNSNKFQSLFVEFCKVANEIHERGRHKLSRKLSMLRFHAALCQNAAMTSFVNFRQNIFINFRKAHVKYFTFIKEQPRTNVYYLLIEQYNDPICGEYDIDLETFNGMLAFPIMTWINNLIKEIQENLRTAGKKSRKIYAPLPSQAKHCHQITLNTTRLL